MSEEIEIPEELEDFIVDKGRDFPTLKRYDDWREGVIASYRFISPTISALKDELKKKEEEITALREEMLEWKRLHNNLLLNKHK